MLGVVVRITGWDPTVAAQVVLQAASHDDPAVCHLGGTTWWPAISKLPVLRYDLFDGVFSGTIATPSSTLTLAVEAWPDFARYALADASFELWTGEVGAAFAQWTRRFNGRLTEQPAIGDGVATIAFATDDRWLDQPLLELYEGTGGAEGDAGLKGTPKPLAIGAPRYVPGVLVDAVDTILQVSAYGPIMGTDVALERLNRFGSPVADYPNFATLKAVSIAPGAWATCNAEGFVRHGAPLEGQPSYLVRGDRSGASGWARTPGVVIKRIAQIAGASNRVSDASLATLDLLSPYPISLWLAEQVTVRDIIQRIAASVNAVAGVSWLGELFVVPIGLGTPTTELRSDGTSLPPTGNVDQIAIAQPFWRVALQAERAWQVHALSDVAFGAELIERGPYNAIEVYREGSIVTLPDGSRWLYVAATPSAGNPPQDGSVYWTVLTKAVSIPGFFTVGSRGSGAQVPGHYLHGLRYGDGSPIDGAYRRSYTVAFYTAETGAWASRSFDVYGAGAIDHGFGTGVASSAAGMAAYLNAIPEGSVVVVFTNDEPSLNRLTGGLPAAMYRCGASPSRFGSPSFMSRSAYILVGTAGVGSGGAAIERLRGDVTNDPNAWLLTSFTIVNGVLSLGSRDGQDGSDGTDGLPGAPGADGRTERTHYAYANSPDGRIDFTTDQPGSRAYEGSYVDFVEADSQDPTRYTWREYKGPPFGMAASGNAAVAGNMVVKNGGAANWNSDAYSTVGFRGSALTSFSFPVSGEFGAMAGLNTDPTMDAAFTSLDFAWYRHPTSGQMQIYESGVSAGDFGAVSATAVYSIGYDGQAVTYEINGRPVRQVTAGPDLMFYFDSSLLTPGVRISNIQFSAGAQRPAGLTLLPKTTRTICTANSARIFGDIGGFGNAKCYSLERYQAGAVAEFTVPAGTTAGDQFAGLATGAAGNSFNDITFSIQQRRNGEVAGYFNGALITAVTTVSTNVDNRYRIAFDGVRTVKFYVNDVLLLTYAWQYTGSAPSLCFAAALAGTDARVSNVALSQAGTRGDDGSNGAPGAPGADGRTSYSHYAYSDSPTGNVNFTTGAPGGRAYIGVYTDFVQADSANPASYTWSPYKGPPNFGLVAGGNASVASNALVVTTSSIAGWGLAGGYSTEGYRAGAATSFRLPTVGGICGLNADPTTDNDYVLIDYAFGCNSNGTTYIYENGAPAQTIGANDFNRRFQIVYDNKTVQYFVNGSLVRTVQTTANRTFFFDAAMAGGVGTAIREITFSSAGQAGNDGPAGGPGAPGAPGVDGFIVDTETPVFVIPVYSSGAVKPGWAGGVGRIKLVKGGQVVTADAYDVVNIQNIASLALAGNQFSFAGATADQGQFTIRAFYQGQVYSRDVTVKKVYDGEAAFKGSVAIGQTGQYPTETAVASGTQPIPGGRGVTVSAFINYVNQQNVASSYQGTLRLYWRNVTDNGPWNLLDQQTGSGASVTNNGTPEEPQWSRTPGTVSASGAFMMPAADKQIAYEARFVRANGSSGVTLTGSLKIEVSS